MSGYIDDYKIESINLFTITGQDKLISINNNIRKTINKSGGDIVNVTLCLMSSKEQITEQEILETFKESGVSEVFVKLSEVERSAIIKEVSSIKSEEKQIKTIIKFIDQLSRNNH